MKPRRNRGVCRDLLLYLLYLLFHIFQFIGSTLYLHISNDSGLNPLWFQFNLYEKVKKAFDSKPLPSQSTLFPKTIKFDPEDYTKFLDIVPFLEKIGYKMREFGDNTIIIEGVPSDIKWGNEEDIINDIMTTW